MHFLIVDDDPHVLSAIVELVMSARPDARVTSARSAREGFALLEKTDFDFVITDVVMESPDAGWQIARAAHARGIAVLLVSSDDRAPSGETARGFALVQKSELTRSKLADFVTGVLATTRL
jgi:DNA-binding NarL/FixJ family response regulator